MEKKNGINHNMNILRVCMQAQHTAPAGTRAVILQGTEQPPALHRLTQRSSWSAAAPPGGSRPPLLAQRGRAMGSRRADAAGQTACAAGPSLPPCPAPGTARRQTQLPRSRGLTAVFAFVLVLAFSRREGELPPPHPGNPCYSIV